MKIRAKLLIAFGILTFIVILMGSIFIYGSFKVDHTVEKTRALFLKRSFESLDFEKNVIQIQQWLTDISATRAEKGFDDGFDEAKKYYYKALKNIDNLRSTYTKDEIKKVQFCKKLEKELGQFYQMGLKMADVYIKEGPQSGNQLMEKFDPFAAKLSETTKTLVSKNINNLNSELDYVNDLFFNLEIMGFVSIALSIIIAVTLGLLMSSRIANSFNQAVYYASEIANNNLNLNISTKAKDESADMIQAMDKMKNRLIEIIYSIKRVSESLLESTKYIKNSSHELADGAQSQAASVEETSSSMEELSNFHKNILSNVENIDKGSKTLQSIAEESLEKIEKSLVSIQDLSNNSSKIKDIIQVIHDISDQTNLLSLNASIEAARAGEHGRGFSVVAEEISRLADRSSVSTKEIELLINESTRSMDESVESVQSVTYSFRDISKGIEDNSNAISKVTTVIQELEASGNEINKAMKSVAEIGELTAGGAEELSATTIELEARAQDLEAIIKDFKIGRQNNNLQLY